MCKINVDGVVDRASSKRTVHVVCRSNQGHFIAASDVVVPNIIIDLEKLEAMACLEALASAEDCGVYRWIVASDCLNVINNIKETPYCAYMMILRDIC